MATDVIVSVAATTHRSRRADWAIVQYKGLSYLLNLRGLWRGLLGRATAGEFSTIRELADRSGNSRSTVSRFFAGRATSIDATLAVLKELNLDFEDVCRPLDDDLLDRLTRAGAVVQRNGITLVTVQPLSLTVGAAPGGASARATVDEALGPA
jgi:hypothetical protein